MSLVLAGPIVRRVEATRACIWIATSKPIEARVEVFGLDPGEPTARDLVGSGESESVRLGDNLFVHLLHAVPERDGFPTGKLLAYDIAVARADEGRARRLGDLGLLDGPRGLALPGAPLPTFFLPEPGAEPLLLHGSCRLLHGKGQDALAAADVVMAAHAFDVERRPSRLYLTGDQIYGDEVGGPLVHHLRELATKLIGPGDDASVPGVPSLSALPIYGRQDVALESARLTSSHAANHLMSFGEFAAMYLTAWNERGWPTFPRASAAIPSDTRLGLPATARQRLRFASEARDLDRAWEALPAVRRALANIPTYMIFDDHDVTDDWNLTAGWKDNVNGSPTGRRIIANALAAYWAFQGWGNDPDRFDDRFKEMVARFSSGKEADAASGEDALWSFGDWCFHVPTDPPTIFLDTRTQRAYDNAEGAAHLMGDRGRETTAAVARRAGHRPGHPLIIVSAVPIYGLELQERRQKFLKDKVGPYEIDLEAWHSNLQGLVDFMHFLIDDLELPYAIFLSGDVHYGMNLKVTFASGSKVLSIAQLVSSSQKHSGTLSRTALDLLGRTVSRAHERIGWDRPPRSAFQTTMRRHLVLRPSNTDEWSSDAPVFVNPVRAEQLNIEEPPDYREQREYVPLVGSRPLTIVGENNLGLVNVGRNEVVHSLLCPTKDGMNVFTAPMETGPTQETGHEAVPRE